MHVHLTAQQGGVLSELEAFVINGVLVLGS